MAGRACEYFQFGRLFPDCSGLPKRPPQSGRLVPIVAVFSVPASVGCSETTLHCRSYNPITEIREYIVCDLRLPLILDPDKAANAWNSLKKDRIATTDPDRVRQALSDNSDDAMPLITGAGLRCEF